jgi:hypothetical protein
MYCPFAYKLGVVVGDPSWSKLQKREISQSGFLDVSRYSVVHPIDLRRVFFVLRKYFDAHF